MVLKTVQSEKTGRINLFVDGEFAFSVNARIFAEQACRDGDEIDEQALEELRVRQEFHAAYEKGLNLLEYRDRTEKELLRRLSETFSREASEAAVRRLAELSLIDDAAYANRLALSLFHRKGWGKSRIIAELCSRGIDRATASEAAEQPEIDEETALENAVSKLEIDFTDRKSVAKAYRKLYSMGFRGFSLGDYYDG